MFRRVSRVLVWLLVPVLGLGAGYAVAAFYDQRGRPVPSDVVIFEPARFAGLDPFTPAAIDEEGEAPAGRIVRDRPCDPEALLASLSREPEVGRAWAKVLSLDVNAIGDYVRSLRSDFLVGDYPVVDHGLKNEEKYAFHAILEEGSAVLVEEDGKPVVRCRSGSPLLESACPPNCKARPTPTPEPTPIPTPDPDLDEDSEDGSDGSSSGTTRRRRTTRTPTPTRRPVRTSAPTSVPTARPIQTPTPPDVIP